MADTGAREPQRLASLIAELRAVAEGEPTTMNQYEAADWLRAIEELAVLAAGVGVPPDEEKSLVSALGQRASEMRGRAEVVLRAEETYAGKPPHVAWTNRHDAAALARDVVALLEENERLSRAVVYRESQIHRWMGAE